MERFNKLQRFNKQLFVYLQLKLCYDAVQAGAGMGLGHARTYLKGYFYGYREDLHHD